MLLVTTTYDTSEETRARALEAAAELGAEYLPRGRTSLARLKKQYPGADFVVAGRTTLEWHPAGGKEPFFFHPGMSLIRAKRLSAGNSDPMLECSGFVPGDSVIDATAGLGADAIVFSFAGGAESRITAVESETPLHFIVSRGLREYESGWDSFDQAMRRVAAVRSDHSSYLRTLPDRSVDIVYFDPMFRDPVLASRGIAPLRELANDSPLSREAIDEALRVARKSVVLKERSDSGVFRQYGFTVASNPKASIAYGVIHI